MSESNEPLPFPMRDTFAGVWCSRLERAVRCRVDDVEIVSLDRATMTFAVGEKGVVVHLDGNGKAEVAVSLAEGGTIGNEHLEDRVQHLSLSTFDVDASTVIGAADFIAESLGVEKEPAPRTMREYDAVFDFLTAGNPAHAARRDRLFALRYNGIPLGDVEPKFLDGDPGNDYARGFDEVMAFAHLAVGSALDAEVANIRTSDPPKPDLIVDLIDGRTVYVEVGRVTASESYFGRIKAVNRGIRSMLRDPSFLGEIQGRNVVFTMPEAPARKESMQAVAEIVAVFRSTDFDTVERGALLSVSPSVAPLLASLKVKYLAGRGISTGLSARQAANWFDPWDAASDFYSMLEKKLKKSYDVDAPLWLALPLTDLAHVPKLSMTAIRSALPPELGQFSRAIVGTMEDAQVIERPS